MKTLSVLLTTFLTACGVSWNNPVSPRQGPQGIQGVMGATGPTGEAEGSSPYMVQFCTNYSTSYPSTFPEYGICVDNQLYAILDQTNGYDYLTLIPQGSYESEATGAQCNFVVMANCQVTSQ